MSVENYQSTVFYQSDSLAMVLAFLFPEIYLMGCATLRALGRNCFSKVCYYYPVNVALVRSQHSSFNFAEKNGSGTRQSGVLLCSAIVLF